MIRRLQSDETGFAEQLTQLLSVDSTETNHIREVVAGIIAEVKQRGDAAVLAYTSKFDDLDVSSVSELEVTKDRLRLAFDNIDSLVREALQVSADRVFAYHEKQKTALGGGDWTYVDDDGNKLGQLVRGISRVGIYSPGVERRRVELSHRRRWGHVAAGLLRGNEVGIVGQQDTIRPRSGVQTAQLERVKSVLEDVAASRQPQPVSRLRGRKRQPASPVDRREPGICCRVRGVNADPQEPLAGCREVDAERRDSLRIAGASAAGSHFDPGASERVRSLDHLYGCGESSSSDSLRDEGTR